MKPYLLEKDVQTNTSSTQFAMQLGEEQLSKISRLLVTGQYSDPPLAALREIISNAYDANTEATQKDGVERHVEITVKKEGTSIRDYGAGLSQEEMNNLYTIIGQSTKENSDVMIGAFGVGRLAPLAANNNFFITSYNSGYKTLYCCYLNDKHIPALSMWEQEPSNEPTGLEVYLLHPAKGDILKTVVRIEHLISGSRFKVKTEVTKEAIEVGAFEVTRAKGNIKNHSDFLAIQDYSKNLYFSFIDPETEIQYDFYKGSRAADQLPLSVLADLGGALYPIYNNQTTYANNNTSSYTLHIRYFVDSRQDRLNSKSKVSLDKVLNSKTNKEPQEQIVDAYTLVIRLQPDSLKLSTSREDIVYEDTNKAKMLTERGLKLVIEEIQRRIDSTTLNLDLGAGDMYSKIGEAYQDSLVRSGKLNSALARVIENRSLQFKYNVGQDKTIVFHRALPSDHTPEDNHIYVSIDKYTDSDLNIPSDSFFYLYHGTKAEWEFTNSFTGRVLKSSFKDGAAKRKPYQELSLRPDRLCAFALPVISSSETVITKRQLIEQLGEEVAERPLLVVAERFGEKIKDLGYVNYLGNVKPREVKESKSKSKTSDSTKNKEVGILLRQLKCVLNSNIRVPDCYDKDYQKKGLPLICPEEYITEDLLKEKVIYASVEKFAFTDLLKKCKVKFFLKGYYPYIFGGMTENAMDRIYTLKTQGLCNWVQAKDVIADLLIQQLPKHHQSIKFVYNEYGLDLLKIVEPYLKDHIPQATLNILRWSPSLIKFYGDLATFYGRENYSLHKVKDTLADIAEPKEFLSYVRSGVCQEMFGAKLEPYYVTLTNLKNLSEVEETFKAIDIAIKVKEDRL